MSKPQAKDTVAGLVAKFQHNLADYKRLSYNETLTRIEFIDPFFEALGWDIANRQALPAALREVIHEDTLEIEGRKKAPDYSFRLPNGRVERKFFLEAKKPAVNLAEGVTPAYQVRRYGWSANLPLSVLTDFEELAVYDCRVRPHPQDKPSVARIAYFGYEAYADRFDEIYDLFGKEAVAAGSLNQFIEAVGLKRGVSPVDAEFLKEIEGWREALARNIALRNPGFSIYDMNFAVQRTIDRIIFLRMAEDRKIEPYGRLLDLAKQPDLYPRLVHLYRQADAKYNAGLFNLNPAADGDGLTPTMRLDDAVLKPILTGLYYPHSPYEFSVLGADILGNVYEQFLGKVIRLTSGHRAKVEEKPEVKKAGGVFYTPTYIVEYIVKQTVGKLLEEWETGGLEGRKAGRMTASQPSKLPTFQSSTPPTFRILDPACGSGSFLIGAYQYLLDYHLHWYTANQPEKHKKAVVWIPRAGQTQTSKVSETFEVSSAPTGEWRLTIAEKKRILLNNIFGLDIDRQAVNVTQLNLLLKALEGETDQTLQLALFQEQVLPQLSRNVKCGNSLIDDQFYASGQMTMFADEELLRRVNAFDWQAEFPQVFAPSPSEGEGRGGGGFDAIIGNPPYIRIQTMTEWAPEEVAYYKQRYAAASKGNYDIYVIFVEKALSLLNQRGRLGFILPHKFFNAKYGEPLRRLLAEGQHLADIVHFGDQQVFANATTYTCLLFLDKAGRDQFHFIKAHDLAAWRRGEPQPEGDLPASQVTAGEWNFAVGSGSGLFERLSQMPVKLGNVAHLFVGLQTDADDVYILEEVGREGENVVLCKSKATGKVHPFEQSHLKRFVKGSLNVRRYILSDLTKRLIFPYETIGDKSVLISTHDYAQRYPLTWTYLKENKARLSARNKGQMSGPEWYGYVYRKNHTRLDSPKLLAPSLATGATFAADVNGEFFFVGSGGGGGGGYGISLFSDQHISYYYLLGLLNSRLSSFFLRAVSTPFRGGYIALNRQYIEQLPIRTIDFSNPAEVKQHDELARLVEQMLALHQKVAAATNPADKQMYQRQIAATNRAIDRLVYQLYGLSEEEIGIVEGRDGN